MRFIPQTEVWGFLAWFWLKNAKGAQDAPSIYATFNVVYDGKLLVDHYISSKRFLNIINKEIK